MKGIVNLSWGLSRLKIEELWHRNLTGKDVLIGHLDTGVSTDSPWLTEKTVDFLHVDYTGEAIPGALPHDSFGHGSQVATLLCGRPCRGLALGVAPDAKLISGMVIESGAILVRTLMGMNWLLNKGVRVICLSMGVEGKNPILAPMIKALRQNGILCVCPVGNLGPGRSMAPGNYESVLTVGASTIDDCPAPISGSYNVTNTLQCLAPDILAPGHDVLTANTNGKVIQASGTSMACAYAAGVASLLFQASPGSGPEDIKKALVTTAAPLHSDHTHLCRSGILESVAALDYLLTKQSPNDNHHENGSYWPYLRKDLSSPFHDPDLLERISQPSNIDNIEAIFAFDFPSGVSKREKEEQIPKVIDRVRQQGKESPVCCRIITIASIAIICGSKSFISLLIRQPEIVMCSTTEGRSIFGDV